MSTETGRAELAHNAVDEGPGEAVSVERRSALRASSTGLAPLAGPAIATTILDGLRDDNGRRPAVPGARSVWRWPV